MKVGRPIWACLVVLTACSQGQKGTPIGTLKTRARTIPSTVPTDADNGSVSPNRSRAFSMDHWKLTLPIKGPGNSPLEISPSDLVAGFEQKPYFERGSKLVFRCPVEGYTTSGSSYPRSELRERVDPDSDRKNWDGQDTYILSASCRVVAFPPKKAHIIVGQIHGYKSKPLVKLRWTNGEIQALVKEKPSSNREIKYLFGRVDDQFFNYQIKVNNGVLELTVNGKRVTHAFFRRNGSDTGWSKERFYFKAGAYVNSNLKYDLKGAYGEVHFKALTVNNPDYGKKE